MSYRKEILLLHVISLLLGWAKLVFGSDCIPTNYSWVYMPVYDDVIINDDILFHSTGITTRAECSAKCGIDSRCKSFFYTEGSSTCQAHTVVFLDPRGTTSQGSRYFRKPTDCYVGSTIDASARLFDSEGVSRSAGKMLMSECDSCRVQVEVVTCLSHGNSFNLRTCKRPSTCSEVKILDSSSTDGEYWLFPPLFGGEKAKIHCHGMSTSFPTEYVTLTTPNQGHYPAVENPNCLVELPKIRPSTGDTTFTKIRINTETMEVIRNNYQFATSTRTKNPYGEAGDCYKNHGATKSCGPKGTFHINTAGTGMIVDQQIQWPKSGWMPWAIITKSNNGLVVNLNCGGYCGGCNPDRPLVLKRFPSQEPALASATTIPCP